MADNALSSLTGASNADPNLSDADRAAVGLADNFDSFLSLLLTQLQQQDPTQPMDTNEFTAQIVQFTSVEQSVKSNQNLEELVALTKNQYSGISQGEAVNYIGKEVTVDDSKASLVSGQNAKFKFETLDEAVQATVGVYDTSGNLIHIEEVQMENFKGEMNYVWNGEDMNENLMPSGEYTIRVAAFAEDGSEVRTNLTFKDTVTAVDFTDGEFTLQLSSGKKYFAKDILKVESATAGTDGSNGGSQIDYGQAVNYIGKDVSIDGSKVQINGPADFAPIGFIPPEGTTSSNINIYDSENNLVLAASMVSDPSQGMQIYNWGGYDNNGAQVPNGNYTAKVYSITPDGEAIPAAQNFTDTVKAVNFADGTYNLGLNSGLEVPITSVTSVQ